MRFLLQAERRQVEIGGFEGRVTYDDDEEEEFDFCCNGVLLVLELMRGQGDLKEGSLCERSSVVEVGDCRLLRNGRATGGFRFW